MHLIIDGHTDNLELMTDKAKLTGLMRECVELAGMSCFGEGYCEGYPFPNSTDDTALTCFQPMGESGMVVHSYPEKRFVFIDFFSCLDFEAWKVISFMAKAFQMPEPRTILLERGLDLDGEPVPARFLTGIVGDTP